MSTLPDARESRPGMNRTAKNSLSLSIVQAADGKCRETRVLPASGCGFADYVQLSRHADELVDLFACPGDSIVVDAGNLFAPPAAPAAWSLRRADLRVVASVADPKLIVGWKGFLGAQAVVEVVAA